jgi:hypothetical protein
MGHHTEMTGQQTTCRRCGGLVRLVGGDPSLPPPLRKAVHDDGSETCAGSGDLAAPEFDPDMAWMSL